jgi:hypothetical protein
MIDKFYIINNELFYFKLKLIKLVINNKYEKKMNLFKWINKYITILFNK